MATALPLALTARYEPPYEQGEYAYVVVDLNGQELLRIISDDAVADTHSRTSHAIRIALRATLADVFRGNPRVHVS